MQAVEELYESAAAVLAWEMSENDSRDIGVINPLVDKTDTSIMNCNYCVAAVVCYVFNEAVRVVIWSIGSDRTAVRRKGGLCTSESTAISAFGSKCVNKYKTCIRS